MNKYCATILSLSLIIITGFCICYHIHISNVTSQYLQEIISIAPESKNVGLDKLLLNVFSKHQQFSENYYQIQNNWLNFWLLITGSLITIITVVTPLMYARKWDEEKKRLESIVKETKIETIIEQLSLHKKSCINETTEYFKQEKAEIRDFSLEKEQDLENLITKAEKTIKASSDVNDLSLSIKNELVEDIKSGILKELIVETIREAIENRLEEKQNKVEDNES